MMILISIFFAAIPAFAKIPAVVPNDLSYAQGVGVEDIQFAFGGNEEAITGSVNKTAIRNTIAENMLGVYRCYAAHYSIDPQKTGKFTVYFLIDPTSPEDKDGFRFPTRMRVTSKDFTSLPFLNCIEDHWSKISLRVPSEGTVASVSMPFVARRRLSAPTTP